MALNCLQLSYINFISCRKVLLYFLFHLFIVFYRKNHSIVFSSSSESITSVNLIKFLLYHLYVDDNINEQWCKPTNNSFLSMLSSTYIDFSQLSYYIKSFSWMLLLHENKDANYFSFFFVLFLYKTEKLSRPSSFKPSIIINQQ